MTTNSYFQFDTRLVEEVVLLRISGHAEEGLFRRTRDRIYEIENAEERERRFREFHGQWFLRLQLDRSLRVAFAEQRVLTEKTRLCAVVPAVSGQDEGADLHGVAEHSNGVGARGPVIIIKLRPKGFLNEAALLPFLRHELMHVADMLDPSFGYEPFLPQSGFGPSHDNLVRERYKVLWDTWITGRLERRGWAEPTVRQKRWTQFEKVFPFLGAEAEAKFANLYESDSQTHRALVELAASSAGPCEPHDSKSHARPCPLCRFPTYRLGAGSDLGSAVVHEITADYPGWQPELGLCDQCADLYRARDMSRTAETTLPGIRS